MENFNGGFTFVSEFYIDTDMIQAYKCIDVNKMIPNYNLKAIEVTDNEQEWNVL